MRRLATGTVVLAVCLAFFGVLFAAGNHGLHQQEKWRCQHGDVTSCLQKAVYTKRGSEARCPVGTHLTRYEDGSGACYENLPKTDADYDRYPVTVDGGRELSWPEDTFGWDCRHDGNRICGHGEDATITAGGCTYLVDGSGTCTTGEKIPPLTEHDADFCHDVDPQGAVIQWCAPPRPCTAAAQPPTCIANGDYEPTVLVLGGTRK